MTHNYLSFIKIKYNLVNMICFYQHAMINLIWYIFQGQSKNNYVCLCSLFLCLHVRYDARTTTLHSHMPISNVTEVECTYSKTITFLYADRGSWSTQLLPMLLYNKDVMIYGDGNRESHGNYFIMLSHTFDFISEGKISILSYIRVQTNLKDCRRRTRPSSRKTWKIQYFISKYKSCSFF